MNNLASGYKIKSQLMMKMVKIMNDIRELIKNQANTCIKLILFE